MTYDATVHGNSGAVIWSTAMKRRERPQCRKALEKIMADEKCSLEALVQVLPYMLSDGMLAEARKMLKEEKGDNHAH